MQQISDIETTSGPDFSLKCSVKLALEAARRVIHTTTSITQLHESRIGPPPNELHATSKSSVKIAPEAARHATRFNNTVA